jgi:hypothetical protein
MKIHLVAGFLLLIVVTGLLAAGLMTDPLTRINTSVIIEAPRPVVWNYLANPDTYDRWSNKASFKFLSRDTLRKIYTRKASYQLAGSEMQRIEEVRVDLSQQTVSIMPADNNSYLENFHNLISINTLPDGSTQVRWKAVYSVRPLVARVLNRFLLKPAVNSMLAKNL